MLQADNARKALSKLPARQPKRLLGFNKLQASVERSKSLETTNWLHTLNGHALTGQTKKEAREALGFADIDDTGTGGSDIENPGTGGSERFANRKDLEVDVEIKDFTRHGMELSYLEGLSDTEFTAMSQVAKRETVVTRWEVRGEHTGPILGIAPTRRSVTVIGMTMLKFAEEPRPQGGRRAWATDEWTYWDLPSLMQQLGAMP